MVEAKSTWLQCVIPTPEWQAINERRQKLGMTWPALIRPAVLAYLDDIEAGRVKVEAPAPKAPTEGYTKGRAQRRNALIWRKAKAPATEDKASAKACVTKQDRQKKLGKAMVPKAEAPAVTGPSTDADLQELVHMQQ